MRSVTIEDRFEYLGRSYYIIDGICYCDEEEIYHSDYAFIRNEYEHYRTACKVDRSHDKELRKYFDEHIQPYCVYYYNDFNIKLYEHRKRKGSLTWRRDKDPETLQPYRGKIAALKSINVRHRYNNVKYGIEKIL